MRQDMIAPHSSISLIPERPILSFVIPAFDEEDCIAATILKVSGKAKSLVESHEIIVVDDGSRDRTHERATQLCSRLPLRVLRLSRNFGKEQALMAGFAAARGQAVVTLDADLQEPLAALDQMIALWRDGVAMAYAVRAHRRDENWRKRTCSRVFYWLLRKGSEIDIPADARDFRLLDRRVVDVLCALPERNLFMKGIFGWVGFESQAVPVELAPRQQGLSKFGFLRLAGLAVTAITSFTNWPLRVWTVIGTGIALAALVYGCWIAIRATIWGVDLPGWSTLVFGMTFLGGVQLFSIGVLGEYIARIFNEVKGRPTYIVASDTTAGPET